MADSIAHTLWSRLMTYVQGSDVHQELWEAKRMLRDALVKGKKTKCPCCMRESKVWSRPMSKSWVRALAHMAEVGDATPRELAQVCGSRDYPTLVYWGLAERNKRGFWNITPYGRCFLSGEAKIPHRAVIWDKELVCLDGSAYVSVEDVAEGFTYESIRKPEHVQHAEPTP